MILILAFVACLGGKCENVEMFFDGTPFQCQLYGQLPIIDWLREHPGYERHGNYVCKPDGKNT